MGEYEVLPCDSCLGILFIIIIIIFRRRFYLFGLSKFAFISKYWFIELANEVNTYITYHSCALIICIKGIYMNIL